MEVVEGLNGALVFDGRRVSVGQHEEVLEVDGGQDCTAV